MPNSLSLTFELESARPEYELSYFPIVERGGQVYLAKAVKKTADMRGYHDAIISAKFPENLATPWRTIGLSNEERVGIESESDASILTWPLPHVAILAPVLPFDRCCRT